MGSTVRRSMVVAATLIVALAVGVSPAMARLLEQDRYSGSEAGTWDDCGHTYEYEGRWEGLFTLKAGRAGDPTPYLTDNYAWHWVNRNPENGKWFTERGQGLYKDVRITHLGGTTYRFIAHESGSPYTIRTSDGERISMDRGVLVFQFDVDTQGDDDLDNDVFLEDSFVLLGDHGSHPQWHRTSDEYCEIVNELLQ
jgi:hypothetical protein